jgi:hypothetical protein
VLMQSLGLNKSLSGFSDSPTNSHSDELYTDKSQRHCQGGVAELSWHRKTDELVAGNK